LAGMDVDVELSNSDMLDTVQEVLANFDPAVPIKEEDAAFTAQMIQFDHK